MTHIKEIICTVKCSHGACLGPLMIKNILNTYYHNRVMAINTELVKGCGERKRRTISEALQCYSQGERGRREERGREERERGEGREGGKREGGREGREGREREGERGGRERGEGREGGKEGRREGSRGEEREGSERE